jgi:hypothetical protein
MVIKTNQKNIEFYQFHYYFQRKLPYAEYPIVGINTPLVLFQDLHLPSLIWRVLLFEFQKIFEASQVFNIKAKAGDEDLVWADVVEDHEEKVEDDIDTNKTADVDGDE